MDMSGMFFGYISMGISRSLNHRQIETTYVRNGRFSPSATSWDWNPGFSGLLGMFFGTTRML
jgi:hypothetical protein